jgi:hypothetical protein
VVTVAVSISSPPLAVTRAGGGPRPRGDEPLFQRKSM